EALEPRRVLLLLLLRAAAGLLLQTLELVDTAVEPLLRRLEQVLADLELARPRVELLAPLAQPLEDRALGRPGRAVLVELDDGAGARLDVLRVGLLVRLVARLRLARLGLGRLGLGRAYVGRLGVARLVVGFLLVGVDRARHVGVVEHLLRP